MEVKHAIAVVKGRTDVKAKLDTALRGFMLSEEYNHIFQQWLVLPEKDFWDVQKVFWTMAALMLFLVMSFLIIRHRELVTLNASLQQQIDEATSQLSQSNEYLKDLTVTDALTGINNRRAFEHSLNELMTRAHRYQQSFSMMIFDIDDFKHLNDSYGHDMGDRVLQEIVDRIQNTVRDVDILCRWGGEEFTVLMPETQKVGALKMAERCRQAIAAELFDEVGPVSISLGVTCYQADDNERKLFKRADDALYQAKADGKNRVVWN
jgi:diguanylate cyclase (GGDEF)-like protein